MRGLRAPLRTLILLSIVLDLPLLARVCRLVTSEPVVESLSMAGIPTQIVAPRRRGRSPTVLFINGAHPERRREAIVERFTRALARAGHLVVVPDLPGLGDGEITPRTLEALEAVAGEALARPDGSERLTLVGASTGAGLAIIAASRPAIAQRLAGVIAVAPFADLDKMTCLVTTSSYAEAGGFARYAVAPLARRVIARSLVALLPERDDLVAQLTRSTDGADPLTELALRDEYRPETKAVLALLMNRDPERFGTLREALPADVVSVMRLLSPVADAASIVAPVEILIPPHDEYFPRGEAAALSAAIPHARLTMTATLDHTRPRLSLSRLRDGARFLAAVTRGVGFAAATG